LTQLGVVPRQAFAEADVDPSLFSDPDRRIGMRALGRLFECCSAMTHCSHFGLLVGERFDLKGLGPIGYLMRNSPSMGDALRSLLLHLHLHDKGAAPLLLTHGATCVILGYSIYRPGVPGIENIYDAAIAIGFKILSQLGGQKWKPIHVQFSYACPGNTVHHRRLFNSTVVFDAELSGIAFSSSWLAKPVEGADAMLHGILAKAIQEEENRLSASLTEQVRRVLPQIVLSGAATADSLANLFGVHERTLRRRLEKEGTSVLRLINATRFELAQQLLENTGLSVTEISAALHYGDTATFSRAFKGWSGSSPNHWRSLAGHAKPSKRQARDTDRRIGRIRIGHPTHLTSKPPSAVRFARGLHRLRHDVQRALHAGR
jgi:AraC-like DNA-binding protein